MAVTEKELEELLRRNRWSINRTKTGQQKAFSARRGSGERRETRYIGTAQKLESMTEDDVLAKLQ